MSESNLLRAREIRPDVARESGPAAPELEDYGREMTREDAEGLPNLVQSECNDLPGRSLGRPLAFLRLRRFQILHFDGLYLRRAQLRFIR